MLDICHSQWYVPESTAEQRLWIAVLETAFEDALSSKNPDDKESACRWFRDGGRNFKLVCDLANFDAGFVRRRSFPSSAIERRRA